MSHAPLSTRRDPRIELRPGTVSVEFELDGPNGHPRRGDVAMGSASGLAFTLKADPGIEAGTNIASARVRIGKTLIQGDLSVRYSRPARESRIEFGCLFYPASIEDSARWMAFLERLSSVSGTPTPHLPVRCANCHGTIWLADDGRPNRHCVACKQEYGIRGRLGGRRLERLHQRARGLAMELGIDLPSAASMLLGILTLGEVRDVLGADPATEPSAPGPGAARALGVDRAFTPAIETGTLTRTEALRRGNRETYARGLIARHRISLEDAYALADNRKSLLEVIRGRSAGQPITAGRDRPAPSSRLTAVAAMAVIVLLALLGIASRLDDSTENAAMAPDLASTAAAVSRPGQAREFDAIRPTLAPAAEFQSDRDGHPTRIMASRPEIVLAAYCEGVGGDPVALATGMVPEPDLWLGIYHDDQAFEYRRAIAIRKDRTTGRWTTGDGTSPIQGFPVDLGQMGKSHDLVAAGPSRLPGKRMAR